MVDKQQQRSGSFQNPLNYVITFPKEGKSYDHDKEEAAASGWLPRVLVW